MSQFDIISATQEPDLSTAKAPENNRKGFGTVGKALLAFIGLLISMGSAASGNASD